MWKISVWDVITWDIQFQKPDLKSLFFFINEKYNR